MRAIGLCIGNYFYEMKNGLICSVEQVKDIKSSGVNHYNFGDECVLFKEYKPSKHQFYAEPIPLTEEWLLKFGFEKGWNQYDKHDYYAKDCWGKIRIDNGYLEPAEYYFLDGIRDSYKIKYIHQLQNLYHALTGEELKVKELA